MLTVLPWSSSPVYQAREDAIIELRKTNLEWTRVANGYFMDYYGYPHVKTYLQPLFFVVDVPNKAAGIPGTGDEVLAFTYTQDVARFTVASLSLPKWEEVTYIYGEKSTFNKLVALAEEARGMLAPDSDNAFSISYVLTICCQVQSSMSSMTPSRNSQRERLQNCPRTTRSTQSSLSR